MSSKQQNEKRGLKFLFYSKLLVFIAIFSLFISLFSRILVGIMVNSGGLIVLFDVSGLIFLIISIYLFYFGSDKLLTAWREITNLEDKEQLVKKNFRQILLALILNTAIEIFFISLRVLLNDLLVLNIKIFLIIFYFIILFYYKKEFNLVLRYSYILNREFPHLKAQVQEVQNLINQNEFDGARNLLSQLKKQTKSLHIKSFKDKKYFIDLDQLDKSLIRSEEQYKVRQKIHTSLLMFSKKYSRILLKEIVDDVKMSQYQVEKITKQFIKDNLIPAKYDEETKAIEFTFLEREIDELLKRYEDWEQTGEGKKI